MTGQPWSILRPHRIRWIECDLYAHANHTAYLTLFEDLRIEHWEKLTGAPPGYDRPSPVVAQIDVRYLRAAVFRDEVMLGVRCASFRRTSFVHEYAMMKEGQDLCTARIVCVVARQDTGEKVPIWGELRETLLAEGAIEG
ncbi:acyl-CoA thioesterase [Falsiroseomonas sp. HW251]|uniref:acyl-CoA thioesterase n=1 Tax=Falsiroseomonas sp. HW251 TaxID=3390998 RepID=UPI003D3187F4